jgi:hypothetical protein
MEVEHNGSLSFLDVLVSRRPDGSLGHLVYRKYIHMELYLHAKSEHHPAQKQAVLMTLARHARTICDTESLHGEIHHLKCIFQRNGYNKDHIRRALHQKQNRKLKDEKRIGIARLPYNKTYCNKISRVLQKFNIRTVHIPWKMTIQTLRSVKDELGLNVPGVYRIPCECDKVYMGQTGRSIETRCKEHRRHIHLSQPDKSVVAKHSINTGHCIDFTNTIVLDRTLS